MVEEAQAHHVFPQKFVEGFEKIGINIHDPHFGAWWNKAAHAEQSYAYNKQWEGFFEAMRGKSPDEVKKAAFEFAQKLGKEFKFETKELKETRDLVTIIRDLFK